MHECFLVCVSVFCLLLGCFVLNVWSFGLEQCSLPNSLWRVIAEDLVREFNDALRKSRDMATAVAAVTVLTNCIKRSKAMTVMELEKELTNAAERIQRSVIGHQINFLMLLPCSLCYPCMPRIIPSPCKYMKNEVKSVQQYNHSILMRSMQLEGLSTELSLFVR